MRLNISLVINTESSKTPMKQERHEATINYARQPLESNLGSVPNSYLNLEK
jgi:hypothetical protein